MEAESSPPPVARTGSARSMSASRSVRGRYERRLHTSFKTSVSGGVWCLRLEPARHSPRRCSSTPPPAHTTWLPLPLVCRQANALLRKNGTLQRRAWVQNLLILLMPILFCLLLWCVPAGSCCSCRSAAPPRAAPAGAPLVGRRRQRPPRCCLPAALAPAGACKC